MQGYTGNMGEEVVRIAGLHKRFGKLEVLKGVDLSMKRGQTVAILGSSGSGKSTLLRCLNLLERADAGSIEVGGEVMLSDVAGKAVYAPDAKLRQIRRKMGMVFQNFNLFPHMSVVENLMEAQVQVLKRDVKAAREKSIGLLEKVGLSDKVKSYPFELSGGQKQRVAIARALAMDPEILCFDEPTSALDPELTGEVLKTMQDLAREHMTMLVVTHEVGFARSVAQQVVFMDGGVVAEEGESCNVIDDPQSERLRAFLGKVLK